MLEVKNYKISITINSENAETVSKIAKVLQAIADTLANNESAALELHKRTTEDKGFWKKIVSKIHILKFI